MAEFFRVHEEAVASYVQPGGAVSDLVYHVARETRDFGRTYIHNRTGRLWRNLQANHPSPDGPWVTSALVWTNIKYAKYVIHGTYGPITSKSGRKMKIPLSHFPGKFTYKESVRGQRANDFLSKGLADAMSTIR